MKGKLQTPMDALIDSLNELTQVMKQQNEINMMLMSALIDNHDEEAETPTRYMDGTPIHKGCKCQ